MSEEPKIIYTVTEDHQNIKPVFIQVPYEDYKSSELQKLNLILNNIKLSHEGCMTTERTIYLTIKTKMYELLNEWLERK